MADFSIEIAGHAVQVSSQFESTRDYCRRYLTQETPEFSVEVTWEDMQLEQKLAYEEALREGFRPRVFTDPFLDRAVIQRKIAEALLHKNVLLFHGSGIAVDGKGYLFTAKSGTGKSTHTRFWMEVLAERASMVNDDKPFLRMEEDTVLLCGAPWSGKHGLDSNITVPLQGICVLERGEENQIQPASRETVLPRLLQAGCEPLDEEKMPLFSGLVRRLAEKVPLWHMRCTKDPQAAVIAYTAMSGGEYIG